MYFLVKSILKNNRNHTSKHVQSCLYVLLARIPVAEHNIDRCRVKDATSVVWY
jgi:hypothetical protein